MSVDTSPASGSMPMMASPSLVGELIDNRYRLTRKLGEGGMGEVYAADHIHIEKKFAIKLLRPEILNNAEAVTRFRQEARSSSSIGHRNIIAIEDFGSLPDGRIYMCMELLNGAPLNDMITQPMSGDRLLNILIQTGHGLAAAHAKGIVHRDMKPENIFVTTDAQGQDVPKILDFGIAKVSGNDGGNHLTRTGTIFGTPFYMAPEQALGNPVDQRTDIYAMGVIAYEVFAGSLPFQGESFMGILTQHITSEAEPVQARAAKAGRTLPNGLAEVIGRCLRKNPAERFGTMDELVNAFIAVYRQIAGPGMSTYMEAFGNSGNGHPNNTPSPITGQHGQRTPTYPTGPQAVPPSGPSGVMPTQYPTGQQQPGGTGPNAPVSAAMHAPTGPGAMLQPPLAEKKSGSKLPLIIILAVLFVGAAGAAVFFLVINKSDAPNVVDKGSDEPKGSGTGSDTKVANNDTGSNKGSSEVKVIDSKGSDSKVGSGGGSGSADPWNGSGDPKNAGGSGDKNGGWTDGPLVETGSNGSADPKHVVITPPPVETVEVAVSTQPPMQFELIENGKKIADDDGSDIVQMLKIKEGATRTFTVKARGFKDEQVTVDSTKKKVHVRMTRIAREPDPHPHPLPPPPPTELDCRVVIKNGKNKRCVAQYCALHETDVNCGLQ